MKNLFFLFSFVFLATGWANAQSPAPDCNDAQAIKKFFEENGFKAVPTTITGRANAATQALVHDHAQLTILMDGQSVNLAETLQKQVGAGASEGFHAMAFITKNENLCDDAIKSLVGNGFDKSLYDTSVNAHIWDNPNSTNDLLFLRVNPVDLTKNRGK